MEPGIYKELDIEAYHGHKGSYSRSQLMEFADCPYKFWAKYLAPNRPKAEPTPAMNFGNAFHTLILEQHLFDKRYVVKPEPVLLKDVGREAYDQYKEAVIQFEMAAKTKQAINQAMYSTLLEMKDKLLTHPIASELLKDARYEQSYFWEDAHSGLLLKARPDVLHDNMIVDLKTIQNASPRYFQKAMVDGGYHIQGAIIRDAVKELEGRDIKKVINIAIEKTYPYSIGIYIIDEFALEEGHVRYKQLLIDLKNAIKENNFPDYDVQTISIPSWALK